MGRVFDLMESEPIRDILSKINHTLKRNKALRNPRGGLRFAAVDGHELFRSRSRCCEGCCIRHLTVNDKEVIEYYHRVVACHLIGFKIPIPLDIEPILPGENEVAAAKRLIERVLVRYARFFDVIVADALYLESSFINFCLEHKKHLISVLKENCPCLLEDAMDLFKKIPARSYKEGETAIQLWDEEGFGTLEKAKAPLRIVHTHEDEIVRKRVAGQWIQRKQAHDRWWATTLPKSELSAEVVRWAARSRWDIENDLFNTLVTHWSMNHCFKHASNAITNFLLTLLVAFVLVQSFYHLNLKSPISGKFTLIAITSLFLMGLASETFSLSWLESLPGP